MSLILTQEKNKERTLPPDGTHVARCVQCVDLGTQYDNGAYGERFVHKVRLTWELSNTQHVFKEENGPQPFVVSRTYTLSLNEKANLRAVLVSWRGRDFTQEEMAGWDLQSVVDAPCMLQVIHATKGENTYANVNMVMKLPKGENCPPAKMPLVRYDVGQGMTGENWDNLPDWMRETIAKCREFNSDVQSDAPATGVQDEVEDEIDSVPF